MHISYGSCAIPYYIEGRIKEWQSLVHHTPEEFIKKRNIDVRIKSPVLKVDFDESRVTYLSGGEEKIIGYKKLLISTGAYPVDPFKVEGKYDNLFVCRDVEHAKSIRNASAGAKGRKALILGSGYIGLEIACAFKEMGLDVNVFEKADHILGNFEKEISSEAYNFLLSKGIKINLTEGVVDFKSDGKSVNKVITEKGEYDADIIILAIGAKPSTAFLKDTSLSFGKFGEIVIDKSMRTNIENVFAAGDCAGAYNAFTGEYTYFPLAQTANRQGKIAGVNMANNSSLELKGVVRTQAMKLFDYEIGAVGLSISEAKAAGYDADSEIISSYTKAYKELGGGKIKIMLIFDKKNGLILGAQLAGSEGTAIRTDIFAVAIYNKMSVEDLWNVDLVYVPPVAPVYDSTLVAARSAMNKLK
jgi:NADPH-dependent 2,4-dienoyl-CoA reductase/sulfur reductase-like enzyme